MPRARKDEDSESEVSLGDEERSESEPLSDLSGFIVTDEEDEEVEENDAAFYERVNAEIRKRELEEMQKAKAKERKQVESFDDIIEVAKSSKKKKSPSTAKSSSSSSSVVSSITKILKKKK